MQRASAEGVLKTYRRRLHFVEFCRGTQYSKRVGLAQGTGVKHFNIAHAVIYGTSLSNR